MLSVYDGDKLLPDYIATGCTNSIKLKDVDFRIPCGKCLPCQKKRRHDWSFRLEQEYLGSSSALFITLTYNDMSIPKTKPFEYVDKETGEIKNITTTTLYKKHVQDYIKRLRNDHVKYISKSLNIPKKEVKNLSKPIRYYLVGEYGSKTRRPHYHILLFNYDINNLKPIQNQWKCTKTGYPLGHVDIGTVTNASIQYVTKYMFKDFSKNDKRVKPFALMSKKPIIGNYYLEQNKGWHLYYEDLTCRDMQGNNRRLPKTFLRRIFEDKEKRLELSLNSFKEFKENKIKEHQRLLEAQYANNTLNYEKSLKSDLKRKQSTIFNNEKL